MTRLTLHRCEITRTRDLYRDFTVSDLRDRLDTIRAAGEAAKRALNSGEKFHVSHKGAASYTTKAQTALNMSRRSWALTNNLLNERLA